MTFKADAPVKLQPQEVKLSLVQIQVGAQSIASRLVIVGW